MQSLSLPARGILGLTACLAACLPVHLHTCAFGQMPSNVCLHMCACVSGGWRLMSSCLLSYSPLYYFEIGSVSESVAHWFIQASLSPSHRVLLFLLPSAGITGYLQPRQKFLCGSWESKSSPMSACWVFYWLGYFSSFQGLLHLTVLLFLVLLLDDDWWGMVLHSPLFPDHFEPPLLLPLYNISKLYPSASLSLSKASFSGSNMDQSFCALPLSQHSNSVHTVPSADTGTLRFLSLGAIFLPDLPLPSSLDSGCGPASVGY